jgi:hypothetical protein
MKKLLPLLLLLIGLGAGVGAGWVLRPQPDPEAEAEHAEDAPPPVVATQTVRLPNQFIVPLIEEGRVRAMVVIGLALELAEGNTFSLPDEEPRLRSVFLQRLFDHANLGGFDGTFTSGEVLLALRRILTEAAAPIIGPDLRDVLITELLRQES